MTTNSNTSLLPDDIPNILYKFRYFDEDNYHLRILTDNEIFFPSPARFNDPFDCKIPIRWDKGKKTQVMKVLKDFVKRRNHSFSTAEIRREAKRLYDTGLHRNKDIFREITEKHTDSQLGIFCLSAKYSNILNWAHYSNSHKGFCIGFNTKILVEFHTNMIQLYNKILSLNKVKYIENYPIINPYTMNINEKVNCQLLTKSIDWEYEDEYRMIFCEGANAIIKIPEDAIQKLFLGCQISENDRENILDIVRKRESKISVFQAKTSPDEFKLQFERIRL